MNDHMNYQVSSFRNSWRLIYSISTIFCNAFVLSTVQILLLFWRHFGIMHATVMQGEYRLEQFDCMGSQQAQ